MNWPIRHGQELRNIQTGGSYQIEGSLFTNRQQLKDIPIIWVRKEALDLVRKPGQQLDAKIFSETFTYPSVNVVAKLKGSDPVLSKEYVLFSGHQDHDGVRSIEGEGQLFLMAPMTMQPLVLLCWPLAGHLNNNPVNARPVCMAWG